MYTAQAEAMTYGAGGYGAFAITLIGLSGVFALYTAYALVVRGASLGASFSQQNLSFMTGGQGGEDTRQTLYLSTAAVGAIVVLTSIALYAGLAIGAHNELQDKSEGTNLSVSLWPHPSWAALSALLSGACLLGTAWRLQGETVH